MTLVDLRSYGGLQPVLIGVLMPILAWDVSTCASPVFLAADA
jgi:hypothetical protein